MVEGHAKRGKVALMAVFDAGDEILGAYPGFFGSQHDRCTVGIIGADVMHAVALHPPRAHPDIGLDVTHQVPKMQRAIGVGQGIGD